MQYDKLIQALDQYQAGLDFQAQLYLWEARFFACVAVVCFGMLIVDVLRFLWERVNA